jgi:hypothetical protein
MGHALSLRRAYLSCTPSAASRSRAVRFVTPLPLLTCLRRRVVMGGRRRRATRGRAARCRTTRGRAARCRTTRGRAARWGRTTICGRTANRSLVAGGTRLHTGRWRGGRPFSAPTLAKAAAAGPASQGDQGRNQPAFLARHFSASSVPVAQPALSCRVRWNMR